MLGGHDARRADEDHAEPNQQWQPVFDKLSHSLVGRLCQTPTKQHGVSQKRPTKSANLKSAIHNPQSELDSPLVFGCWALAFGAIFVWDKHIHMVGFCLLV